MVTHDLAHGWFINLHDNGTATIRNPDKGLRIDLEADSLALLRKAAVESEGEGRYEIIMGRMVEFSADRDVWRWKTEHNSFSRGFDSRWEARENACAHLGD